MTDDFDQIVVLRGHLEDFLRVFEAAYGKASAEDLARAYGMMGSGTHRPSNLTRALGDSCDRVRGYLSTDQEVLNDDDRSS